MVLFSLLPPPGLLLSLLQGCLYSSRIKRSRREERQRWESTHRASTDAPGLGFLWPWPMFKEIVYSKGLVQHTADA